MWVCMIIFSQTRGTRVYHRDALSCGWAAGKAKWQAGGWLKHARGHLLFSRVADGICLNPGPNAHTYNMTHRAFACCGPYFFPIPKTQNTKQPTLQVVYVDSICPTELKTAHRAVDRSSDCDDHKTANLLGSNLDVPSRAPCFFTECFARHLFGLLAVQQLCEPCGETKQSQGQNLTSLQREDRSNFEACYIHIGTTDRSRARRAVRNAARMRPVALLTVATSRTAGGGKARGVMDSERRIQGGFILNDGALLVRGHM